MSCFHGAGGAIIDRRSPHARARIASAHRIARERVRA